MADGSADGRFQPGNPGGPGRPTHYNDELGAYICEQLKTGMTLIALCRRTQHPDHIMAMLPNGKLFEPTIRSWAGDPDHPFSAQYIRAREVGYMRMADEVIEISDDSGDDIKVTDDGQEVTNHDVITRSRLRVDTRKWLMSKALPKIYGDRVENRITGPDGGSLQVEETGEVAVARKIAFMLGRAVGRQETVKDDADSEPA